MPYVPSTKTDGQSDDRLRIDTEVSKVAKEFAPKIQSNSDILRVYMGIFQRVGIIVGSLDYDQRKSVPPEPEFATVDNFAEVIFDVGKKYNYEGAFLGELNYAITRLIQEIPKELVALGKQKSELRYFLYAYTVEALVRVSQFFTMPMFPALGIGGVFVDIKDEYKRRVNTAYEVAQIIKSGDCYDTPYLTQPAEVVDEEGKVVGHIEVMINRENYDGKDVSGKIRIQKK